MTLSLEKAKCIFILSKGDIGRMPSPEDSLYSELSISSETEKSWIEEMKANGVVVMEKGMMPKEDDPFSLYEARALFELTDGQYNGMIRDWWPYFLKYEEIVSKELHQKWCCELIDSYYIELCQKKHIDVQEFRHFLEMSQDPCLKENYDRAIHLMEKILLTSDEDRIRLVRGLMGVRDVCAQDGLAFWAYKYRKTDDVSRIMVTAHKLLDDCIETASQDTLGSIEYYKDKWKAMMDIFGLDKILVQTEISGK